MRGITATLASLALAAAALGTAAPALAAPQCTGTSCDVGASVSVLATITETVTASSFSFNNGQPVPAGQQVGPEDGATGACVWYVGVFGGQPQNNFCPDYHLVVTTGDGSGYIVQASGTDFQAPNGDKIPISALTEPIGVKPNAGFSTVQFSKLTNSPVTQITSAGASAGTGDDYPITNELQIPADAGNQTFTSTFTYTSIAN